LLKTKHRLKKIITMDGSTNKVCYVVLRASIMLTVSLIDVANMGIAHAAPQQSLSNSPPNTLPTPGQVQSTLPVNPQPSPPKTAAPVKAPPAPVTKIPAGGPAFKVSHFSIQGNTVFPDSVLQAQLAAYVNRKLTLAELYKAADQLTQFYQHHGYGVARVAVPQQQITNGVVRLEVVEGKIGKLTVSGNIRTRTGVILARAANIQPGTIYTDAAINRDVLLINDLPGIQAQAILEPGSSFGTVDVDLKTLETPAEGFVSVDNYGRDDIGRWRINTGVDINSLTGSGDRLSAYITHAESNLLNYGDLVYSLPMPPAGGMLNTSYSRTEYHVSGATFNALGIAGYANNATMNYLYPAVRDTTDNFYWGFGIIHTDSGATSKGQEVTHTNLNLLNWTVSYNHRFSDGGYYALDGQFYTNGQPYGANHPNSERARLYADGTYVRPFAKDWLYIGKFSGQWAPDPLTDIDKYSLGGPDNVRGFLSAEARGDSGVFASVEIQRNLPVPSWPLAVGWYVDSGKVWNKTSLSGPSTADTLTSVGTELVLSPPNSGNKGWNGRLEWAYAVGGYRPSDGNEGGHIWLTIGDNF
jgi:hemolysin activation/secretion protein